jgi:hypothetical protein
MKTSIPLGKDLRSRIGRLASAIGFAFLIGCFGVGPALAGGGGHNRGGGHDGGGGDRGRQQEPRHEERRSYDRHEYAPVPDYYAPPNYYYAPPPTYYEAPPPPPSEGWTFVFPLGR